MTDPNTGVVAEIGHPGISWDILDTAGTFETWDMCSGTRDRTK